MEQNTNSLRSFFYPRSVAVVGASRDRGTVGGELFHNLVEAGFTGKVYPVNCATDEVQGHRAYRTAGHLPEPIDLAVIAVPAPMVLGAAQACAEKSAKAIVVISAGFAEMGGEGLLRQTDLVNWCRQHSIRLIGPNCIGIANTDRQVNLNATFGSQVLPRGNVALLSQSGGLGLALIDEAARFGVGLSSFVSYGNKADVSVNDLLEYWEHDSRTEVIALYLESLGNPRKFFKIASRVGKTKPVVVLKSGRTMAGTRAAASHTGAMLAASDVSIDALFRQAGVIRVPTLEDFFDVCQFLARQRRPAGRRVGILTNAGGPGIMCADACEAEGLDVRELSISSQKVLREFLPAEAGTRNPVDLLAAADFERFLRAIAVLSNSGEFDSIIVLYVPVLTATVPNRDKEFLSEMRHLELGIPHAVVLLTGASSIESESTKSSPPVYRFPESAARAISHVTRYSEWRAIPRFYHPPANVNQLLAAEVISKSSELDDAWLTPSQIENIFKAYAIPIIDTHGVSTAEEARAAAATIGEKVVLKAWGQSIVHKSELGAVLVGLNENDIEAAFDGMKNHLKAQGQTPQGYLVQPMLRGLEMFVGVVHNERLGPIIACGAGGTSLELIGDIQISVSPVGDYDAWEMLRKLRSFPLLTGYRGNPACNISALADIIVRVAALADANPEICELDCNPVIVTQYGAYVVDARIKLAAQSDRS